jgi:protein TonB
MKFARIKILLINPIPKSLPVNLLLCILFNLAACSGPTKTSNPESTKPAVKKPIDSNATPKATDSKKVETKVTETPPQAKTQTFAIPVIKEIQPDEEVQDAPPAINNRSVKYQDAVGPEEDAIMGTAEHENTAYTRVDVEAKFPGGSDKFIEYVTQNFEYPARCQEQGIMGYVLLRFIVDTKGQISEIKATDETKACPEFTLEAIRVMKKSPKWIPGMINGRFVKSYRTIPIKLDL